MRLEPGKIEIGVPLRSTGWSGLTASLTTRGNTLAEDSAGIHLITSRGWIVILFALAALVVGIVYVIVVSRSRRG